MADQNAPGYEPTTTHAGWGAGDPRLLISRDENRSVHRLTTDATRIGSASGNELQLPDTDPVHATIVHDERDEYVVTLHGVGEMNANPDAAETGVGERSEILRTGARFTTGPWTFVFTREEFADHGRPYGGREGGELSDQLPQPARPDYQGHGDTESERFEVKDG